LLGTLISLVVLGNIAFSQNQVRHRVTEGTEREIYLFFYREIPMDENNLEGITFSRDGRPINSDKLPRKVGLGFDCLMDAIGQRAEISVERARNDPRVL
jgi:hypothetical protein